MLAGEDNPRGTTRPRRVAPGLESPQLGHADDGATRHEQVVQNSHVDSLQHLFQSPGNEFVGVAELANMAGGVMNQQARRRLLDQTIFTTSRGCTLAPSIVPRKSSTYSITR